MQKILNVTQIRQADAATIANEPVSSLALLERAANAFTQYLRGRVVTWVRGRVVTWSFGGE